MKKKIKSNLILRFRRAGTFKNTVYHIVVANKNKRVNGSFFEKVGFYAPSMENKLFFVNYYRLSYWLLKNIKISPRVAILLGKILPFSGNRI